MLCVLFPLARRLFICSLWFTILVANEGETELDSRAQQLERGPEPEEAARERRVLAERCHESLGPLLVNARAPSKRVGC